MLYFSLSSSFFTYILRIPVHQRIKNTIAKKKKIEYHLQQAQLLHFSPDTRLSDRTNRKTRSVLSSVQPECGSVLGGMKKFGRPVRFYAFRSVFIRTDRLGREEKDGRRKMAEESEKRFEAIMKKLFHAPSNSRPNSNDASGLRAQQLSGRKRPHSSSVGKKLAGNVLGESGSSLSGLPTAAQAPVCRPWDRGDLLRRLSTFKSMTWFAKPEAVSPLECARRGWVNVDMDTIACVSCNTRLLFSTPSAWAKATS